jgi:gamma-glutamyltranspeptidase / glutathione hydrolase
MAATGHYLATAAAVRILERGGNAIDAGVAAGFCLNVVQPDATNLGGVAPILVYSSRDASAQTISGVGPWPRNIDPNYFASECDGDMPPGLQRCVVPAAADAWLAALQNFGSLTLEAVLAPAIELASEGFPMHSELQANLSSSETVQLMPSSRAVFYPHGHIPRKGEVIKQHDLAQTFSLLIEAERENHHQGRENAVQAARDRFYRGDIASTIAKFSVDNGGFLALADLNGFKVKIENPVSVDYRDCTVLSCPPWSQGPVVLQALSILQGYDFSALQQNSADCLHLILEALKAAFADRERYYGDPDFIDVPLRGLLHPAYAANWRQRIMRDKAAPGMPEPGKPKPWQDSVALNRNLHHGEGTGNLKRSVQADTSYICVIDNERNAFSATPSDGILESPIIPGLGFAISDRGTQSWLDPTHPNAIAPGKRPRITPNPGLITRDGLLLAAYGTPGGDVQPQAMVQFVTNLIDFQMDPQLAIESPRIATMSVAQSFHPHASIPDLVMAENRLPVDVVNDLRNRGHRVEEWPAWSAAAGSVCSVVVDSTRGTLLGAADPRRTSYALGW